MSKSNPYGVPGSHYGHMVQETLMLIYLLQANEGDIVSLEYFDDVGIEAPDGQKVAIQAKSGLSWNPLSDRSVDLWKTISNWTDMVKSGELNPSQTKFLFTITKERKPGPIACLFQNAKTPAQGRQALEQVKKQFEKKPPTPELGKYVYRVLKDETHLVEKIIQNFDIEIHRDPHESAYQILRKHVEENYIQPMFNMMTGWLKNTIEILIRKEKIPYVDEVTFRKEFFATRRLVTQQFMLTSYASEPNQNETVEHLTMKYVKQLELIECGLTDKLDAIANYIKARDDRIKWADDGIVHEASFDAFYQSLKEKWKNEKRKSAILHKDKKPKDQGMLLFSECNGYRDTLGGLPVPPHFTPGCFHDCADKLVIGWHPLYEKFFSEDNDD